FIGTVRFGNDHFGAIMGYGDYVVGESVISRVYYVEGLGHNLFSVGQFCDSDLEVAFRKHSCYVRDTDGVNLIKGSRGSNLYTILVEDMMKSSPILEEGVPTVMTGTGTARAGETGLSKQGGSKTPQQNHVVKRRNRTLIEAARTMMIFSKASMFLWAEVVATACYTQNHKLRPCTKSGSCNSLCIPTNKELEILFQPMFDEYLEPPRAERPGSPAQAVQAPVTSVGTPLSTTIDQDAPSPHISPSSSALQSYSLLQVL
nr:putative ribonuclease H-like domain-containing protein [Tanacetum cinerariifolium]